MPVCTRVFKAAVPARLAIKLAPVFRIVNPLANVRGMFDGRSTVQID
jgi:hypothetical protein